MKKYSKINLFGLFFAIIVIISAIMILKWEGDWNSVPVSPTQPATSLSDGSVESAITHRDGSLRGGSLIALMVYSVLFGVLDAVLFLAARHSIDDILNNHELSAQVKLEKLKNEEILLDLPLYLGLLGTVLGFLFIAWGVSWGRETAYISTILGIIVSAAMRVFLLRPCRSKVLEAIAKDKE